MSTPDSLPTLKRHITTNNDAGMAIFHSETPQEPPSRTLPDGLKISFCYGVDHFPVKVAGDVDLQSYDHMIQNPPGMVISQGTVLRIVDFPPGYTSPMHRTVSVNFNVVIEGEVELILDSGEKRVLGRGDSAIQRAINHAWRNTSATEWARISAVPLPVEPFQIGDQKMEEAGLASLNPD